MAATANEQVGDVRVTKGRDPNNVHPLVVEFVRELQRRFRRVRGLVRKTVGHENDAFRLAGRAANTSHPPLAANADPADVYDFPTDAAKRRAFITDLRRWIDEEVLETTGTVAIRNGQAWWAEFIENAYVQGTRNATGRLMQVGVSTTAAGDARAILDSPVAASTLEDLYTRTFEELDDISDEAADSIRQTLTRGFAQGWHPRKMADEINGELEDITRSRAVTIARTETIRAASDATIDRYREAGVEGGVHADRLTAADARVCPFCRRINDETFTLGELATATVEWRGQVYRIGVPSHPNGRCTILPALNVGELPPLGERVPGTVITN